MSPDNMIRPRLHPEFPGPIGNPKAGRQARMSYIGTDGKRHWHRREMRSTDVASTTIASVLGESLASVRA